MDFTALEETLRKHRFTVSAFATKEEAVAHLENTVKGETVGFGGSVTIKDMDLYERLGKGNKVIWHQVHPDDRWRWREFTAYVSSANALAQTGEIVNIDGTGNRLAATLFGPKKVYFVVGRNKIAPDLAAAIDRARNIASPLNAKRLNTKTPCVKDGKCHDCNSPDRICGTMSIHWRPMRGAEHTEVILIDEDLGY